MNIKMKRFAILTGGLFLITSCGVAPRGIENVEVISDPARQQVMYEQALNSKIEPQSDGTYAFKISGVAKLGTFSTNVSGSFNYNFDAVNQKVTGDLQISGTGLNASGVINQDQQLVISVKVLGINAYQQTQALNLVGKDLPELINLSILGEIDKDTCLTNYRTATYNDNQTYNVNLFEVRKATSGQVCPIPTQFRANPTIGFIYDNNLLKGAHLNAELTLNEMNLDLVLYLVELDS